MSTLFPTLYNLSLNHDGSINQMGDWEAGSWKWCLKWISGDVENQEAPGLLEFQNLLEEAEPKRNIVDAFDW